MKCHIGMPTLRPPHRGRLTCLTMFLVIISGRSNRHYGLKANARGFRNFDNYRTRILFFCGKLHLKPATK